MEAFQVSIREAEKCAVIVSKNLSLLAQKRGCAVRRRLTAESDRRKSTVLRPNLPDPPCHRRNGIRELQQLKQRVEARH